MSRYTERVSEWKKEKMQIAEAKEKGKIYINHFEWNFWIECEDGLYRCIDVPNKTITQSDIDNDLQHNTIRRIV